MNAEQVTEILYGRLAKVFGLRGFVLTGEEFSREAGGVRQFVGFALADYAPFFRISVLLGLRVHASERILNQFTGGGDDTKTCSVRLFDIAPEVEKRLEVKDELTLDAALARLIPPLESVALPLLDAHRDVLSIERLFNGPQPPIHLRKPEPYRSLSGVILAHLVRNPNRDRLIEEYRPRVERQGLDCLRWYEGIVEYLKGRALGET
jgi:hypothetical protein